MAFVAINSTYRDHLARQGLTEAGHFLALPGVIVTGHPDRHVLQLTLGTGASAIPTFLKKEHRVSQKDRLASAWAGFGWVSKSCREAAVLRALAPRDIGCAEWIAAGEDDTGRAFLLIRERAEGVDLRHFLRHPPLSPAERRRWARALGEALARLHATGFNHPDLYSKHVLVHPRKGCFSFLDWQRSRKLGRLSWRRRGRDLAALNATLADDLASARERLICFRAYCRFAGLRGHQRQRIFHCIRRQTEHLLKQRRIREMRQPPLQTGAQSLIWLEGEALCVTPEFHALLRGQVPPWLSPAGQFGEGFPANRVVRSVVPLPDGREARLVRRRQDRPFARLTRFLGGSSRPSPELEQVGLLYRCQRYGILTPKLLAFGQGDPSPGRTESFLLTEPLPESHDLLDWLADRARGPGAAAEHRRLIRQAAAVLRALHAAGCGLDPAARGVPFCVGRTAKGRLAVGVSRVESLRRCRRERAIPSVRDLTLLLAALPVGRRSRTEALRFLLAYLGRRRLTAADKRTVRRVLRRTPFPQQVSLWTSPCVTRACFRPGAAVRPTSPT